MSSYVNYINNYRNVNADNTINNNMINNANNNQDNEEPRTQTFYYLGQHTDGCDRDGPTIVYHYISEEMRNGRNLNMIDIWDYDLELWPGDRYWSNAGRGRNIMIEVGEIPY
jgi:hypothetical protein